MPQFSLALLASLLPVVLAYPQYGPIGTAPAPFKSVVATPLGTSNATVAPIQTGQAGGDRRTTLRRTRFQFETRTVIPSPPSNTESPIQTDASDAPVSSPVVVPIEKHLTSKATEAGTCGAATVTVTSENVITVTVTAGPSATPVPVVQSSTVVPVLTKAPLKELATSTTAIVLAPKSTPVTPADTAVVLPSSSTSVTPADTAVVLPSSHTSVTPQATVLPSVTPSVTPVASTLPLTSTAAIVGPPKTGKVGGKRGLLVSGNTMDALVDAAGNSPKISWMVNWFSAPPKTLPSRIEFVPENYGKQSDLDGEWTRNAKTAIANGATHFLGFGEAHTDNDKLHMEPAEAVSLWMDKLQPYTKNVKVSAPSIVQTGHEWLVDFLNKCEAAGCDIGFLAIHWFWKCTEYADFQSNVQKGIDMAKGKPVWIDNFQCSGSEQEQIDFLSKAVPYLDGLDSIERYAYVPTDSPSFLDASGKTLSTLGQHYVNL